MVDHNQIGSGGARCSGPEQWPMQGWDAAKSQGSAGQLGECCLRATTLGEQLYPNDTAFPLAHVALRLEQVAAGQWPEAATPAADLVLV